MSDFKPIAGVMREPRRILSQPAAPITPGAEVIDVSNGAGAPLFLTRAEMDALGYIQRPDKATGELRWVPGMWRDPINGQWVYPPEREPDDRGGYKYREALQALEQEYRRRRAEAKESTEDGPIRRKLRGFGEPKP